MLACCGKRRNFEIHGLNFREEKGPGSKRHTSIPQRHIAGAPGVRYFCMGLCASSRSACMVPGCGCARWALDNYGEVGKPERCACGHGRAEHSLDDPDRLVQDADMVKITAEHSEVPPS